MRLLHLQVTEKKKRRRFNIRNALRIPQPKDQLFGIHSAMFSIHLTYKVPHVHHNHKANIFLVYNYHVHSYVCQLESFGKHSAMFCIQYSFSYDCS